MVALSLLLAVSLPLGWRAYRAVRGTSLFAAVAWDWGALVAIGAVEWWIARHDSAAASWVAPLRWLVASMSFGGWMTRLGARRPHQAGWQLVVATLWLVLALPAAEVFLLQRGQRFEVHGARGIFLWLLVAGGIANSLPTRAWGAGLFTAAGQMLLFADSLPGVRGGEWLAAGSEWLPVVAVGSLTASLAWRGIPLPAHRQTLGETGVWLDFRDLFGSWWSVRVLERVNATAASCEWPVRLGWSGFLDWKAEPASHVTEPASHGSATRDVLAERLTDEQRAVLRQTLWNLVRRFVAPEWVGERLGGAPRSEPEEG